MAKRRTMKSVLDNFVGTFTSRYSDFQGYWIFGQILSEFDSLGIDSLTIDLLSAMPMSEKPLEAASRIASLRFREQLEKHHFPVADVRCGSMTISRGPDVVSGTVGQYASSGYIVEIIASAALVNFQFRCRHRMFVAPHNPRVERRRLPSDWGEVRS